jgi:hypothetical protein
MILTIRTHVQVKLRVPPTLPGAPPCEAPHVLTVIVDTSGSTGRRAILTVYGPYYYTYYAYYYVCYTYYAYYTHNANHTCYT